MSFNLESLRSELRPYVAREIELPVFLEKVWQLILASEDDGGELAASVEDLLGLHAAAVLDERTLRHELISLAYSDATVVIASYDSSSLGHTVAKVVVSEVKSSTAPQASPSIVFPKEEMLSSMNATLIPA